MSIHREKRQPVESKLIFVLIPIWFIGTHRLLQMFRHLRNTFVSMLVESGADIATTRELTRHANARATFEVYAKSEAGNKREALQNVENRLNELKE